MMRNAYDILAKMFDKNFMSNFENSRHFFRIVKICDFFCSCNVATFVVRQLVDGRISGSIYGSIAAAAHNHQQTKTQLRFFISEYFLKIIAKCLTHTS